MGDASRGTEPSESGDVLDLGSRRSLGEYRAGWRGRCSLMRAWANLLACENDGTSGKEWD